MREGAWESACEVGVERVVMWTGAPKRHEAGEGKIRLPSARRELERVLLEGQTIAS